MGLLSSAFDAWQSSKSARRQFQYNKELMKMQQEYQTKVMQNSHQWEVEDLRNAGLNPILSAGGSGASTGGASSSQSVGISSPARMNFDEIGAINSAVSMLNGLATNDQIKAQTDKIKADENASTELAKQLSASAEQMRANTAVVQKQLDFWNKHPEYYQVGQGSKAYPNYGLGGLFGGIDAVLNRVINSLSNSGNSARSVNTKDYPRGFKMDMSK